MNYFIISNTSDISIIGNYPQIEKVEGFNYYSPNGYLNVSWKEAPTFTPEYAVNIHWWANPTNLLHSLSGFYGLTIDNNFKELVSQFNLPRYNFFPIDVYSKGQKLDYFWFHFINSFLDYVDFDKSEFEKIGNQNFQSIEQFKVKSVSDLNERKRELTFEFSIKEKKIALKPNFPNYDIISLSGIKPVFLVSERLKNAIEDNDITGCQFSEFKGLLTNDR